jgi:hypothetical protein
LLLLGLLYSYNIWVARRGQRSVALHGEGPSQIELLSFGQFGSSENITASADTTL